MIVLDFKKVFKWKIPLYEMKKEVNFAITLAILALAFVGVYYFGTHFTGNFSGFAVLDEYTNQTTCENAGYTWENITEQNCTTDITYVNETIDCEPCLEYEIINETTNETGECINWTSCVNETSVENETCVDVVVDAQCVGDVCDSEHLDLCEDETTCEDASGYWYDDGTCNADECSLDAQCESGYECSSSGSCVAIEEETVPAQLPEESVIEQPPEEVFITKLELSSVGTGNVVINPNKTRVLTFSAKDAGNTNLVSCKPVSEGDNSDWVSIDNVSESFSPEDEKQFSVNVAVPEGTAEGTYTIPVALSCLGVSQSLEISVEVVTEKIKFNLLDVRRIREDKVRVFYELNELTGAEQDIGISFKVIDVNKDVVAELAENHTLKANQTDDFKTDIFVNESYFTANETSNETSEFELIVDLNSQIYSASVEEPIVVGSISGFAILGGFGTGGYVLVIAIVLGILCTILIVRKVRKKGKNSLKGLVKSKN